MSDLLNKASLVMVPSGYKEDTVYSVVPTDGSGDLAFARASNGTRINSAGLVEVVPWNLIDNSQTFSNWAKVEIGQTVTVTDNFVTAPNGTLTGAKVVFSQFSGNAQIFANYSVSTTQNLTSTLYAKVPSGTKQCWFGFYDGSGKVELKTLTTEWQRIEYTGSIAAGGVRACWFYGDGGASNVEVHLWGGQLNVGSTAKPYFPTTDRLNVPRLTYQNGGGGCPSLLLEKQSTNLVFPSEDLTAWSTGGMTNTANQTTSPDGTQNADKSTIGSTTRYYDAVSGVATTVGGTTYTTSFFAKKGTGIEAIYFYQGDGGAKIAKWNLNNGAYIGYAPADGYGAFTSQTSESLGNGWYRFSATYTASGTSGNYVIGVSTNTNDSVTTIAGNGTDFVYIWGLQYEASSYPTSYIPTTSTSATRVKDVCYKNSISSLIGQSSGVVFADIVPFQFLDGSYIGISDNASTSNRQIFGFEADSGNSGTLRFYGWYTGSSITCTAGQRYKIAMAYANNDFVIYVNGTQVVNETSGTVTGTLSHFGFDSWVESSQNFQGQINQAILFPTRLTNAELASLTTI